MELQENATHITSTSPTYNTHTSCATLRHVTSAAAARHCGEMSVVRGGGICSADNEPIDDAVDDVDVHLTGTARRLAKMMLEFVDLARVYRICSVDYF